jgi:hypothetical protein
MSRADWSKEKHEDHERGIEFQDYILQLAMDYGLVIQTYSSSKYQLLYGEGFTGAEIKLDTVYPKTGNLYIEHSCKNSLGEWEPSGIYDKRHWLYIIGDYNEAFVLFSKQLRFWHTQDKYPENKTENSKGMLLPVEIARKFAAGLILEGFKGEYPATYQEEE